MTWEGAAEATLRHGASLSLAERLAWLEEAGRIARHLQQRRSLRDRDPAAGSEAGVRDRGF